MADDGLYRCTIAAPGERVIFRINGTGDPIPAQVLNPGPLGQCVVQFLDGPAKGATFAVANGKELFTTH